jgi:EGF domain-specific O-GlcNAc transferase
MTSFQEISKDCSKTLKGITLLVDRDDVFNVFHALANFINAYLSLLILNIEPKVDRVIILDGKPDGPYWDLWKSFSDTVIRRSSLSLETVCLEKAIFTIPGGSNFIWKDVWVPNDCYHSSILKSFVRFSLNHFRLLEQTRREKNDSPVRILLSSRQTKPGGVKPGRRIINEDEIENILKNDMKTPEGKRIPTQVVRIDLGTISFHDQIKMIRNTDVYIGITLISLTLGMHGAGMTHLIFLPDEAVVVEMFPKGWHQSSMRNLAKLTNKVYLAWQNTHDKNIVEENSNVIDNEEFRKLANSAVHVALSFHLGKGML